MNTDYTQIITDAITESGSTTGEIRVNCICQGSQSQDKTLGINIDTGVYHCHRCNIKGNYLKKNGQEKKLLAEHIWDHATRVKNHPYIIKKQIHPKEIRTDKYDNWVVPFCDRSGQLQTVQLINPGGKKRFLKKAKNNNQGVIGAAYKIDGVQNRVYVCEGPATGWSIREATGATVYCVGGKENFKHVLPWVKEKHETVIVGADNDSSGAGLRAANTAAAQNGLNIVIPPTAGMDFNDYVIAAGWQMAKTILEDHKEPEQVQIDNDDEYLKAILEINSRHAGIMLGGKFQILNEYVDPLTNRPEVSFSSIFDFKNRYANKTIIKTIPDENGGEKKKSAQIADEWLKHPLRREYDGIVFDPSGKISSNYYNLWTGLAHSPQKGNWNLLEAHILNVIADGDYDIYQWIIAWMARITQNPGGKRPGTSVVMRGKQGTGKGLFVNFFGRLFGKHFLQVAHASQVTGRFNNHFKDSLLVFVDEGFWAGDKQAEGIIKNLITEPFLTVEQKGKDLIKVKNHVNLMIATNNAWAVPAGLDERRFFVIDVSDKHKQDHKYFKAIVDQMENGGIEAMLYDLLEMDISQVNLRKFKQTAGLFEQKLYSMDTVQKFWFERLKEGALRPVDPELTEQYGSMDWDNISVHDLYNSYLTFANSLNDRFPLAPQQFGSSLRKMCKGIKKMRPNIKGTRINLLKFPSLKECRKEFDQLVGIEVEWNDIDVN